MFYDCNEPRKNVVFVVETIELAVACSAKINIKHSADKTKHKTPKAKLKTNKSTDGQIEERDK
jgi:hypothetical protein